MSIIIYILFETSSVVAYNDYIYMVIAGNIYTHITKSRKEILAKDLEHTFSNAI